MTPRLPALCCGALLLGLAACAPWNANPPAAVAAGSGRALAPLPTAPAPPPLALSAAPNFYRAQAPRDPGSVFSAPAPSQALRDDAAVALSCRDQADRTISQRDRGELIREDERDSRLGSFTSTYTDRAPIDRLGRRFERDRIAEECFNLNNRTRPPVPAAAPAAPPTRY
jgi:hypothetical protein